MRSAQKSNRPRGRGNRKGNGGANLNRVYESNGPEGKVRGTPQQIIDKYLTLARDAQTSSDRVNAENFLQHAEHYQRLLAMALEAQQERREPQQQAQPQDGDDDSQPQRERSGNRGGNNQDADRQAPPAAAEPAPVTGMQTIDAGDSPAGPELIVTPEDLSGGRGRGRGNGSSRRKAADSETPADPPAE